MSMTLSETIHLLGDLLGDVLRTQESPALFAVEERIRALAKGHRADGPASVARLPTEVAAMPIDTARAVASAFALYFDLVNLAEEAQRIQELRRRARERAPAPIGESIGEAVARLRGQGVTPEEMASLLGHLQGRARADGAPHRGEAAERAVEAPAHRGGPP